MYICIYIHLYLMYCLQDISDWPWHDAVRVLRVAGYDVEVQPIDRSNHSFFAAWDDQVAFSVGKGLQWLLLISNLVKHWC